MLSDTIQKSILLQTNVALYNSHGLQFTPWHQFQRKNIQGQEVIKEKTQPLKDWFYLHW